VEKRKVNAEMQRVNAPYEQFLNDLQNTLKHPTKKIYRADRSAFFSLLLKDRNLLTAEPREDSRYDTKENRWAKRLVCSVTKHLSDLEKEYPWEEEAKQMLLQRKSAAEELLLHRVFRSLTETKNEIAEISSLNEEYRKLYHSYVVLNYALCEIEAEIELALSEAIFEKRDVLVGSFGSEAQWKHNLARKYYYAPEQHFDPTCFPIRYVALYQSSHFSEKGVCYYGAVTKIRRIQRKRIWFPTRRKNGEEWYLLFRVKRWQRLARPIEIQDEGVFAPKYTNLFLLQNAEKTFELFHIHSLQEYRVWRQLKRILANAVPSSEESYPIEGGKSIRVHNGMFDLRDERGMPMRTISVLDFQQHPISYLDDLFACVAKAPEERNVPLWLQRENEAYFERYGKPYSDD